MLNGIFCKYFASLYRHCFLTLSVIICKRYFFFLQGFICRSLIATATSVRPMLSLLNFPAKQFDEFLAQYPRIIKRTEYFRLCRKLHLSHLQCLLTNYSRYSLYSKLSIYMMRVNYTMCKMEYSVDDAHFFHKIPKQRNTMRANHI